MRLNALKSLFAEGRVAFGTTLVFPCPELVEACGLLGFDFVFIDAEHDGFGPRDCQDLVRAADATGVHAVVRVPRNEPQTILGYLETGALSIVVPHVNSPAEALAGLQATRYPPAGNRGAGSSTRAAGYGIPQSATAHFTSADSQVLFLPILEEAQAYDQVDAILQVPGLEAILLGPGDLALSMGYPGQPDHPAVQALVQRALAQARQAGIFVGTAVRDAASARACAEQGFQFVLASSGTLFAQAVRHFLNESGRSAGPAEGATARPTPSVA